MRVWVILAAGMFLGGCAASPTWYKDGATQASFDADKAECEYEAIKYGGNAGTSVGQAYAAAMHRQDIALACMRKKGYSQTPPTQKPLPVTIMRDGERVRIDEDLMK